MAKMSMRDRILAVIQGREHDRVPFVQYDGIAAPNQQVWDVIGRDNLGIIRWSSVCRMEHPNCRYERQEYQQNDRKGIRTTLHTPAGRLTEERLVEPIYGSSHITRHYIQEPNDYKVFLAYLRDVRVLDNVQQFLRDQQQLGDDGVPMVAVGRTPYQQLWIQWVSIENLALHLVDCPDLMDEVMSEMARIQRQTFEFVRKAPIPFVDFPDNITAPTIGERYFRQYCVPLYNELADMLADKGVPVFVHMDGDLKPLAKAIGECKVRGIDSFSPAPDNDTTVAEAVRAWPRMRLLINFPSSVHLKSPAEIYAQTERMLAEGGRTGRLQIQISENVPPGVWRTSFPEIVKAIHAFGRPGE